MISEDKLDQYFELKERFHKFLVYCLGSHCQSEENYMKRVYKEINACHFSMNAPYLDKEDLALVSDLLLKQNVSKGSLTNG